jgi:hypothetical protein
METIIKLTMELLFMHALFFSFLSHILVRFQCIFANSFLILRFSLYLPDFSSRYSSKLTQNQNPDDFRTYFKNEDDNEKSLSSEALV